MIPDVSREHLLDAMARFDRELRDSQEWADWQEQGNRKYAIEHEGRLYPVKQIIVLATGIERGAFKGGDEANSYVEAREFKVVPIEEDRVRGAATPAMVDRLAHAVAHAESVGGGQPYDLAALDRLVAIFKQRFSSFSDQAYLDGERTYKLMAAERMDNLIGQKTLRGYIEQGQFEQAKAAIVQSCRGSFQISPAIRQQNNLLNQWDQRAILDAAAEPLARRLYDLLYGDTPFAQRFEAWVDLLTQKRPGAWPAATYFRMLQDPDHHIFVKPMPFQFFLKSVAGEQSWPTRPDLASYKRFQDLGRQLLAELAPLGARDMIDVQSFIWSAYYYSERSAWIFQSNPQYYDLPGALEAFDEINWIVRQHDKDIKSGDTVYLWEAGDDAGILAVARALGEPSDMPTDALDRRFYREGARLDAVQPRVPLHIEQVLPQHITREDLLANPVLKDMAIIKQPRRTNFKLTDKEAEHLAALVENPQIEMTGAQAGLSGEAQIRIALQEIVDRGGSATVAQIYAVVEARIGGRKLSQQGKDSLRTFINREAVNRGYVYPYDGNNPVWRITPEGRAWLESGDWPPNPLDGPAFVLIHGSDHGEQIYGRSYVFSNRAGGAPMQLVSALEASTAGDDAAPVYVIIYRPGPHYAFTAWARVADVTVQAGTASDERLWKLTLDQHEFPIPLALKGTSASLSQQIGWLAGGLQRAFGQRSIRQITPQEFTTIIDAARTMGGPMTPADAAFAVLSQAGGGPLSLKEIYERAQQRNMIDAQVSQLDLATALQRDVDRFAELGGNMWLLAGEIEPPQPKGFEPKKYFSPEASFWRIHFPRELWDAAHTHDVIGIDWPVDSTNQSVQRLKRVKVGDRVVVYLRGAVIASIGVVTRAFFDVRVDADATPDPLGGRYPQRIGVAWADAPATPVDILDALRADVYTSLYNRLRNPHTVIPLSRDDYSDVLMLLHVDDVGTAPPVDIEIAPAWPKLTAYRDFAQLLDDRAYSAAELFSQAHEFGDSLDTVIDQEELIDRLRQLRLISNDGAGGYRLRDYVAGDSAALVRLMALALLLPIEGTADSYSLPARSIVGRIQETTTPQLGEQFVPELGASGLQLLRWYAEAGLIAVADGGWQPAAAALDPLPGDDPATTTYNQFLATLLAEHARTLVIDLSHAEDQALARVPDIDARLRELAQELLIDTAVVRRIYRSLLAGRHVVLSGPPGTGKTELAKLLPSLLWREAPQTFDRLTTALDLPPVEQITEQRHGYAPLVVTATEDWGVRDVVGGIGPRLDDKSSALSYTIEHGALTRIVLQHYEGSDRGRRLPAQPHAPTRRDYRADDNTRYRGAWLVIDEFTRAPVDAAFGSLLTTLSGGEHARLAVPTASGEAREVPLPRDFRIIGTLNSFDRHFLNQISEAMKRRFDFIDVVPPHPRHERYEQGIAVKQALLRLRASNLVLIAEEGDPATYRWEGVVSAEPESDSDGMPRYAWRAFDPGAQAAIVSFWRIFSAIRIFRQLGTAQVVAVYTNLFAGVLVDMAWDEALDTALADSLADQLQVLTRDEQELLAAFVTHAGATSGAAFVDTCREILQRLPAGRQRALLHALREADQLRHDATDIQVDKALTDAQIIRVFEPAEPLQLPIQSVFRKRLRDLIGERGL